MSAKTATRSLSKQSRLLALAVLFLLFQTAALSLADGTRLHSELIQPDWPVFVPFFVWLIGILILFKTIRLKLPTRDPWIFPTFAALVGWGLLTVWRLSPSLGLKQLGWYLVGCVLFWLGLNTNRLSRLLKRYKYVWLLIGLLLIDLTFFVGVNPTGAGPQLWLQALGFYLQPSEPLKLLIIVYLAAFFADQIKPNITLLGSVLPTLIVAGMAGVLLIVQRDLGTASLFVCLYVLMLTVTTQKRRFLLLIPLVGIAAGLVGYFVFDVVRARIDIWLDPWAQASGNAYQLVQAQIAIASGGLAGTGPGLGSPSFIPVAISDFIFPAVAEETGLIGGSALILLMMIMVIRGISIAQTTKTTFGRYLAFGIASYLGLQTFFIIAGNLGLLPLTGITLPFFSYGGSSLVTNLIAVMLLLKISSEPAAEPLPENVRRPYRWVAAVFLVLFTLLIAATSWLAIFQREELLAKPENPRWVVYDRYSPRGRILSQSGDELAVTTGEIGDYERKVLIPSLSNTIGFTSGLYGQDGLELSQYQWLRGYSGRSYDTLWRYQLFYNQPPPGVDIKLTINTALQTTADALLGDAKGAVVLLNATTGEIYALASHPYFDANTLTENWEQLRLDPDAPMVNRTTQATYPLGTLVNSLGLATYYNRPQSAEGALPEAASGQDQYCQAASIAYGEDLSGYQGGCEQAALALIQNLDPNIVVDQMEAFGLFTAPTLSLRTIAPSERPDPAVIVTKPMSVLEIQATPLQMALIAASITNDGLLPSPRLRNTYLAEDGAWKPFREGVLPVRVMESGAVSRLRTSLIGNDPAFWFQSAHALTRDGKILTWYIGGTTEDWVATPLAIAVAIESNAPDLAQTIGSSLLSLFATE